MSVYMADQSIKTEVRIDPLIGAVEITITARIEDEDLILDYLNADQAETETRTIYFFDTPDLGLFEAGEALEAAGQVRPRRAVDQSQTRKGVQASADFLAFLTKRGLVIDGNQQTKTRGALTFFTSGTGFDCGGPRRDERTEGSPSCDHSRYEASCCVLDAEATAAATGDPYEDFVGCGVRAWRCRGECQPVGRVLPGQQYRLQVSCWPTDVS